MKKGKDAPVSSAKVLLAVVVAVLMLSCPLGALAQVSTIGPGSDPQRLYGG